MSKNSKPIIVVAGEPKSVFLEIFFKTIQKIKIRKPLILIVNKKLLLNQLKLLRYRFELREIDVNHIFNKTLDNKKINFINVPHKQNMNNYIEECFIFQLKL